MEKEYRFVARVEKDSESGAYIGYIPGIPGAKSYHTYGANLDEILIHLEEVLKLCLAEMSEEDRKNIPEFAGSLLIKVSL